MWYQFFCDADWSPEYGHLSGTPVPLEMRKQVWMRGRALMSAEFMLQTLQNLRLHRSVLSGVRVGIWAPREDRGVVTALREQARNDYGDHFSVGAGDLFVDVGSNLGIVTIKAALSTPGGRFLAIEAAPPTWLMQQLNLYSNVPLYTLRHVHSVCAGLSDRREKSVMTYRPWSTTSTRDWNPESERDERTVNIAVQLRPLSDIYAEVQIPPATRISVLKLDCEGCEYSVVPSFSDAEFALIDDIVGEIHWGYMPPSKQPPKPIADKTHGRLCRFRNFADAALECCMHPVPTLPAPSTRSLCQNNPRWFTDLVPANH